MVRTRSQLITQNWWDTMPQNDSGGVRKILGKHGVLCLRTEGAHGPQLPKTQQAKWTVPGTAQHRRM